MKVKSFTFNDFYENTYVVYDNNGECIIIDPGCNSISEQTELLNFIQENKLLPVHLINTHCHIDHILGNKFIGDYFGLKLTAHRGEIPVLSFGKQTAEMYQIHYELSPPIEVFIDEGDQIKFGDTNLEVLFTPGHSPASISLLNRESKVLICGDVLFQGSIGRTDLPGGNFNMLINVIKTKFFNLDVDTDVYSGHGESTTIGIEKTTNPFLI